MKKHKELPKQGLLTRSQFQPFLGVKSRQSVYNMIKRGEFPQGYLLNQTLRVWRAEDIHKWLDNRFPRQKWNEQEQLQGY